MKRDAKDALEQVLTEDELHLEDVKGELFVGNRSGLNFAVDLAELRDGVDKQDRRIFLQDVKISSLEDRVGSLTTSLDDYKKLRNRFISTLCMYVCICRPY